MTDVGIDMDMETTTTIQVQNQNTVQVMVSQWKELHRQINNLAYVPSKHELYCRSLDLLMYLTSADSATYFHLDQDTNDFVIAALRGSDGNQHLVGLRIPQQEVKLQAAFEVNEPIVIGDLNDDPLWLRAVSPSFAARMTNLISLPLFAKERSIGVIHLYNYKVVDLDLLEMVRDRIAIEIDRKTEFESTKHSNEQLKSLIHALGQIGGTLDRKQMLKTILEQSASLVDAERTSIYITAPGTNEMNFQLAYQPESDTLSNPQTLFPQSRNNSSTIGKNRSIVTIPLSIGSSESTNDGKSRQFGGLIAIKPNSGNFSDEETDLLKVLVTHASTFFQAAEIFEGMEELFFDVIEALVVSMEAKDPYTQGHSKRVSEYSVLIAQILGLEEHELQNIRIGSLLHDVGKIGIPDDILKKKGKVTPEEYATIQCHPMTGWKILREVRLLEPMLPAIIEHHEKLDGSGYPYGLRGERISLMGRIVAVADVFDAMTSDRPYRKAIPVSSVISYLEENAGILFDHRCVDALITIVSSQVKVDV